MALHSSYQHPGALFRASDLDIEEAETENVKVIDRYASKFRESIASSVDRDRLCEVLDRTDVRGSASSHKKGVSRTMGLLETVYPPERRASGVSSIKSSLKCNIPGTLEERQSLREHFGGFPEVSKDSGLSRPTTGRLERGLTLVRNAFWRSMIRYEIYLVVVAFALFYSSHDRFLRLATVKLSWWLIFAARQLVTLDLARIGQLLIVDVILLGHWFPALLDQDDPYIAFGLIQSRGWPLVTVLWALWDFVLLQGADTYELNWLHFVPMRIFNEQEGSGSWILVSDLYRRVLVGMIVTGIGISLNRSFLALRFGRIQIMKFRPWLEKLLADIVIVSEVAILAHATLDGAEAAAIDRRKSQALMGMTIEWNLADDADDPSRSFQSQAVPSTCEDISDGRDKQEDDKSEVSQSSDRYRVLSRSQGGAYVRFHDELDSWIDPVETNNDDVNPTIHEVLVFQRALNYIDDTYPFGEAFGAALSREESIGASQLLFQKLLKRTPGGQKLPFSTLRQIGQRDGDKMRALRKIFRPDKSDYLTLLAFIQSVDAVYKRLTFFQASVRNSMVIDLVLESIQTRIFFFFLSVLLLYIIRLNPWPIIVSMTSILVSISFAMGPSVAKYVEGVIMIAARRPYELGDRIVIASVDSALNPDPRDSWFVEDIKPFKTILRHGVSNEVACVSNPDLASARITNLNNSQNAIVEFTVCAHIRALESNLLTSFRTELTRYAEDNPRKWNCYLFCREEEVDADMERVDFTIAFRHQGSWQDTGRILIHRGNLVRKIYLIQKQLGIAYEKPGHRGLLFYAGSLEDGRVKPGSYKTGLLSPSNIRNVGNPLDLDILSTSA